MALQHLNGLSPYYGWDPWMAGIVTNNGFNVNLLIDLTGEMVAFLGKVWFPGRTGTKDIQRVGFLFGTIAKGAGSALTVSLQDVSTATGPPGQPDGTQDQTVAIANADASFASNTWYRTGTLSANRTVSQGDDLAVVIEYDGGGRTSPDSVQICGVPPAFGSGLNVAALKTGGAWAINTGTNVMLEFSDGTFGSLGGWPFAKAYNAHSIAVNTGTADEYALAFKVPLTCKIDGVCFGMAAGGDFEVIIYSGTTPLTGFPVTIDANRPGSTTRIGYEFPVPETQLTVGTQYYLAIRPTSTTALSVYSLDVADANHLTCFSGGVDFNFATRVDQTAWSSITTTRRLVAGLRLSAIDDGAGGGAAGPIGQSRIIQNIGTY